MDVLMSGGDVTCLYNVFSLVPKVLGTQCGTTEDWQEMGPCGRFFTPFLYFFVS